MQDWCFPNLGESCVALDLEVCDHTLDARFHVKKDGVRAVGRTLDRKVEFVGFENHSLALVTSALGYPAYYPVPSIKVESPLRVVLMDLDGTTVHSEQFWVWIIEKTVVDLLGDPKFKLEAEDEPHVSGHSVSEHLKYCIEKYCPDKSVQDARRLYFKHSQYEMNEIVEKRGRQGAFKPAPGIKDFLYALKDLDLQIGLVTSGLYEKVWPVLVSVFRELGMGDPSLFYDAIITAGQAIRLGEPGTLGELSPKPHPWLYAETARVGLGIPFEDRHSVIGIEDSAAGICSVRLAGFAPLGISGGNIEQGGARQLCHSFQHNFTDMLDFITNL
jgi:beta-phosphoglucomutase-like phosphatase (HAD superfamily)